MATVSQRVTITTISNLVGGPGGQTYTVPANSVLMLQQFINTGGNGTITLPGYPYQALIGAAGKTGVDYLPGQTTSSTGILAAPLMLGPGTVIYTGSGGAYYQGILTTYS